MGRGSLYLEFAHTPRSSFIDYAFVRVHQFLCVWLQLYLTVFTCWSDKKGSYVRFPSKQWMVVDRWYLTESYTCLMLYALHVFILFVMSNILKKAMWELLYVLFGCFTYLMMSVLKSLITLNKDFFSVVIWISCWRGYITFYYRAFHSTL